jgi:cob(I)alamin adenosyltransferase
MQLMISSNFDQVKSDLAKKKLSPKQRDQVKALASEVEEGNASISKLVIQEDFPKAVATAKDVQTKIYNAQLILAGQKPAKK